MPTDPLVKTITEITEEALQPVQVPLVVGSEYFVVTQQDVRKTEMTRHLHFSRVNQNGALRPAEATIVEQLFEMLRTIYLNTSPQHANQSYSPQQFQQQIQQAPQPMEMPAPVSHTGPKATVKQQLKWSKCSSTSVPPSGLRYSCGTSTTDLSCYKNKKQNFENQILSQDTNGMLNNHLSRLDAREQLKHRKKYSSMI